MKSYLLSFFSSLSALEEQVEVVKHVLCERSENNLFPIFQYLDQEDKGYIDFADLNSVLQSLHPDNDIHQLIQNWSISIANRVNYQDFLYWILPLNTFPKAISNESIRVSHDQKYSIQRIFSKEIEFYRNFLDIKAKFKFQAKKNILSSFDLVSQGQNSFTRENLMNFLQSNGIFVTESNVFAMMRRIDKDADGLVSVTDFADCFSQDIEFAGLSKVKSSGIISSETRSSINHGLSQRTAQVSKLTENSLKRLLKGFIKQEKTLEQYRNEIAFRMDFSISSIFKHFDKKRRRALSEVDFESGLKSFGIRTSCNNIFLIFRHFDSNSDGFLILEDFYDMLASTSQAHRDLIKYRDSNAPLSIETKSMITKIFLLIIEIEQFAEDLRRRVVNSNATLVELFQILDVKGKGKVTASEFRELLKRYKIQPTINDLSSLVKRFDSNKDGKVDYSEFVNQVTPKIFKY